MKKKIINVFLMALISLVAVGTVVSCKDYEEDNYSELNGKFTNLNQQLQDRVDALEAARDKMQGELDQLKNDYAAGDEALKNRIDNLEILIGQLQQTIEDLKNAHQEDIDELWIAINEADGRIDALEDLYEKLGGELDIVTENKDKWSQAVEDAASALQLAKLDSARLDSLGGNLADYDKMRDALAESLKDADGNWMTLEEYIESQGLVTADDIKNFVTDETLQSELEKFQSQIDDISSKLETLNTEINTKFGLIQSSLNKYVSSVLIQGTDNPVFGSFAFPANITSNVLAAYYGDVKDLRFPTNETYNYVDATTALTAADLKELGVTSANQFFYNGRVVGHLQSDGNVAAGNAGTLYVTVNPNTVNAEGATPVLVNSQDVQSGVMLSELKKSDKVLNFGYTRAADNGFYEAAATVTPGVVESVSPRISYSDLSGLKDKVKEAVNAVRNKGNVDVTGLIYSVYSISSNILDAQAVKFPWSDTDIYGNTVERATYSQYSLAATAVHPLSYGFAYGLHYDEFPGINKIEDIIGGIFDKIEDAIPNVDVDDVNIHINIDDFKFEHVALGNKIIVTVEIDGVKDAFGNPIEIPAQEIDITQKVEDAVNDALGSAAGDVNQYLQDVVNQLNSQVGQINDIIDQLRDINEIGNKLSEIEDKIYDYLSRGENLLLKFVNNANNLLQPVMLAKTSDSYVVLSRSASAPTKFSASSMTSDGIILRPTSYSAEVLAPAFKKFVGVANVYKDGKSAQGGNSDCQSALKAVNSSSEGFCTVQEGDWNKVQFKGAQKGYVYEIVYTAADYSGKIVVKRFYIELV